MVAKRLPDELLAEVEKLRHVPGIVFADDTSGRVPRVAGTGIEVWEIISTYKAVGRSWSELQAAFPWLTPSQIRAAIRYYEAFPEEVEAQLEEEQQLLNEYETD